MRRRVRQPLIGEVVTVTVTVIVHSSHMLCRYVWAVDSACACDASSTIERLQGPSLTYPPPSANESTPIACTEGEGGASTRTGTNPPHEGKGCIACTPAALHMLPGWPRGTPASAWPRKGEWAESMGVATAEPPSEIEA